MFLNSVFTRFFQSESTSGLLLIFSSILALIINNSSIGYLYENLLELPLFLKIGGLSLGGTFLSWVNDGLMSLFFLIIGLEIKREILIGRLSNVSQIILPSLSAIGGMVIPACIYWFFNQDSAMALRGWAIPIATDIAFALGILALLGNKVPPALKLFLMTLAIVDDIGAVVAIGVFYSEGISVLAMSLAASSLFILITMNILGVIRLSAYIFFGLFLWIFLLKSGVHPTISGIFLALCIPLRTEEPTPPPLLVLEKSLHKWVSYGVLPLFAFLNTGISFSKIGGIENFINPITEGIVIGLLFGKTLGVFGTSFIIIKMGLANLPNRSNWVQLFGVSVLCGIGFTMSFFVGALAFNIESKYVGIDRIGILTASILASISGYIIIFKDSSKRSTGCS